MQTVIVPICKNKNGNISDAGNYRPVSLVTIISKLFEHYILCGGQNVNKWSPLDGAHE